MSLTPAWRNRIVSAVAAVAAVWLGQAVAEGNSMATVLIAALGIFIMARWLPIPFATFLLGVIVFGYIVGNRGFAQVSISSLLPILPAEAVLAYAGATLCIQCAYRHELPFRPEPLNVAVLLWMVIGTVRVMFDLRMYGFLAVRDYAMVYYAAFFFLGQEAGRDRAGRSFLQAVLLAACALLLPVAAIYNQFPNFFLGSLTVRGVPLIFLKGDLLGTFFGMGSVLFFLRHESGGRWWNLILSLALGAGVLATSNRASMIGLMLATVWLLVGRRWRFAAVQAVAAGSAAILILVGASVLNVPWEKTPVYGVYERVASMADLSGTRTYHSEDSLDKGDNNVFRRTWWMAVIDETIEGNPYVGLGFGHDLAERFAREYYADANEEFATRSPHNILLTVFARMGAIGLGSFLLIVAVVGLRTWRAVCTGPREAALWCGAWVIFASACLGVVLEGPMGAVVFWTVLGLANESAESSAQAVGQEEETPDAEADAEPAEAVPVV